VRVGVHPGRYPGTAFPDEPLNLQRLHLPTNMPDFLTVSLVFIAWFALQRWVLPRLGVPT